MKVTIIIIALIVLLYSPSIGQIKEVLVGDTDVIGSIGTNDHCRVSDFSYSHPNQNFYLTPYSDYIGTTLYWGLNGDVSFAPKSIGVQTDSFSLSGNNYFPDCQRGGYAYAGPYIVVAKGVSDSVALFRTRDTNRVKYYWLSDSTKYIAEDFNQVGLQKIFGLFNNIDDSTIFTISMTGDLAAEISPTISIESKSFSLPESLKLEPKTRWVHGSIYLNTISKGFSNDTTFICWLKVVMRNTSTIDSFLVQYYLEYLPRPTTSVMSKVSSINFWLPSIIRDASILLNSDISNSERVQFQIFDALGRPQPLPISDIEIPAGTNSQKIDVGNISSGWYMLRMKMKDQVINKSFMMLR
jgi:hypothetical protein